MKSASKKIKLIQQNLHFTTDLKVREVQFFDADLKIVYLASLTDKQILNDSIVQPLLEFETEEDISGNIATFIQENVLYNSEIEEQTDVDMVTDELLKAKAVIIVDGCDKMLLCDAEKIVVRPIQEPPSSAVIKGPREGFNESIKYNLSLIRHKLPTENLVVDNFSVGKYTKTQVAVIYLSEIADKNVVKEVERRISKINIDGVIDSYYISAYLQSNIP